jgi:hypothetical protein
LPDRSRRLLTRARAGFFFSPSLDGGLPLLVPVQAKLALKFTDAGL